MGAAMVVKQVLGNVTCAVCWINGFFAARQI
jgi:hypothetical protein